MIKHTQTVRRQFVDKFFECDHFVGLALKGLIKHSEAELNKNLVLTRQSGKSRFHGEPALR